MAEAAQAFVPGHATVFFSPRRAADPARTGATGAGLVLSDGVTVGFEPGSTTTVTVNGDPGTIEPVDRVLGALGATGRATVESPLPIGEGFGVSGAATLGTALAANRAEDLTRSENELVAAAHVAEVQSNTGLGDVVAQARGGVPIRLAPGAPPHARLDGVPAAAEVEYVSFGELSTADVITADLADLQTAGDRALAALTERPALPALFEAGRRFAREAGLLTDRVASVIDDVRADGGEATMVMLGETVIALGSGLSDAGYDASACRTHPPGASVVR